MVSTKKGSAIEKEAAPKKETQTIEQKFSGNFVVFHAFDVGDDIDLAKISRSQRVGTTPQQQPRMFKNYHIPLSIELPRPHNSSHYISCTLHHFGVISMVYKVAFHESLSKLRNRINEIDYMFKDESTSDTLSVFKKVKPFISQPKFYHMRTSYMVIQADPIQEIPGSKLKEEYGNLIASLVRFEDQSLSEYQRTEILASTMGYYRGELLVIDKEASFVYDAEYEETLPLFEFANIQRLELYYFDRLLDRQLNYVYENRLRKLPLRRFLPFVGLNTEDPVAELGRLRVDISVIIERLSNSIKASEETYYAEIYDLLSKKLDFATWRNSIDTKLGIIKDIRRHYQSKIDRNREDLLTVLIIILILIELIVALAK